MAIVIGGGNAAVEGSILLSKYAKTVFLVYRGEKLWRPEPILIDTLNNTHNIKLILNNTVVELIGDEMWRVQQIVSKTSAKIGESGLNILNIDAQEETSRIIVVVEDSGNNIERAINAIHQERSNIKFV